MNNFDFGEQMKVTTKTLAKDIILFIKAVPEDYVSKILVRQLVRSATSTAANYRAVCRARSKGEFFAKLSITIEEADETLFWLELLEDTKITRPTKHLEELKHRATKVRNVLSKARKNTTLKR
ncbi:MAG: four helix bundle protein [Bacteroidota bacterium]